MPMAAAALLALFSAAVQVEGTTTCPPPDLVAARLDGLLPAATAGEQRDRARLWEEGDDLVVLLERANGALVGTRRLPRTYACEDLAYAAAVSVADWESDVHPEFAPQLTARGGPASPAVRVSAQAFLPTSPSSPPSSLSTRPWRVSAGLAVSIGGSIDKPAGAAGALIGAWLTPGRERWAFRADAAAQSEQQISLQDGQAVWRRWSLDLGVERPFAATAGRDAGWLRAFALARLAWLDMRGQGFTLNRSQSALDPGAAVGARAVLARGRWSPWVEAAATWWPVHHNVQVDGIGDVGRLPAVEAFVSVGVELASAR
jgi:hypothetical protein